MPAITITVKVYYAALPRGHIKRYTTPVYLSVCPSVQRLPFSRSRNFLSSANMALDKCTYWIKFEVKRSRVIAHIFVKSRSINVKPRLK